MGTTDADRLARRRERARLRQETTLENARLGYQTAISLWIYEGNLIWSKYNAMLVANSLVLASTGISATGSGVAGVLRRGLPLIGLSLCVLWTVMTKRGLDYHSYWILSARELEERYLQRPISIVTRGADYSGGRPVRLTVDGADKVMRMGFLSRHVNAAQSSYLVIGCFALIYLILLF